MTPHPQVSLEATDHTGMRSSSQSSRTRDAYSDKVRFAPLQLWLRMAQPDRQGVAANYPNPEVNQEAGKGVKL
jgi:hypothetical protein